MSADYPPKRDNNSSEQPVLKNPQDVLINAPVGIFTTTPDGRYLYVNNTLAQMHGYDSPRQLMDSVTDIATQIYVNPADREELKFLLEKHGSVTNLECLLRHTNGSHLWVSENIRVIKDKNGNVIAYQGFNQDITERKKAENELHSQKKLMETVINGTWDILSIKKPDHTIEFYNQAGYDLIGLPPEEVNGRKCFELIGCRQTCSQCSSEMAMEKNGPVSIEKYVPELGVYLDCRSFPVLDEEGNIVKIVQHLRDTTDSKRAEEALRVSEERFRLSMEAIKDGLWDWDATTGNIYCSPGLTSMLGYDSTDVLTHVDDWRNLIHPEDRQKAYQANLACANNLVDSFKVEYRMKTRNGGWRWILGRGSAVKRDESGKALRMIGTHQDITEQKQTEERIRHLNAVLQAYNVVNRVIFNASEIKSLLQEICQALISTRGYYNAWIILLDKEQNVTNWGQAGLDDEFPEMLARFKDGNLNKTAQYVLSSPLMQVIIDPENECRDCPLAGTYKGKSSFSVRLEVEGFVLGLLTVSVPTDSAQGSEEQELFTNLARTIAQGIQRIRLEKIRRIQRERLKNYKQIISRVNDPMSLMDTDYRYIIVNDAYLRFFGKSREEIEGHLVEDLLGKDIFLNQVKHHLDSALAGGVVVYEDSFPDSDGSLRHKIMNYYPFHDKDGQVVGIVSAAKDITDRKRAEDEIRQINQKLERANAEKDKLFTIIAHDLKSPMSGLYSTSQILAKEAESLTSEEVSHLSAEMHKSMKNTLALLNDLMQWARMNQGGMDFSPEQCSLHELARSSLYTARDVAEKKNITIRCDIPQGLTVQVDQPMINTVIRNLIFNAVKFTPQGGNISLTARETESDVEICVQDDGIGMDEAIKSKIFSLDKSKRQYGTDGERGTGLGLIMCKEFVEKHGGGIWVKSEPGKGTKVCFTLPAVL